MQTGRFQFNLSKSDYIFLLSGTVYKVKLEKPDRQRTFTLISMRGKSRKRSDPRHVWPNSLSRRRVVKGDLEEPHETSWSVGQVPPVINF